MGQSRKWMMVYGVLSKHGLKVTVGDDGWTDLKWVEVESGQRWMK